MMQKRNTAFYLSTLVLLLLFVLASTILTNLLTEAQRKSVRAEQLTTATALARNAAEAVSSAGSEEELLQIFSADGNAAQTADGICVSYDKNLVPDAAGNYRVTITWEPEKTAGGVLVNSAITVKIAENEKPVYAISTAVYLREGAAQ